MGSEEVNEFGKDGQDDELYLSVSLVLTATGRKLLHLSLPAEVVDAVTGDSTYVQARLVLGAEDAVRLIDGLVGGLEAGLGVKYERTRQTIEATCVGEVANAKVDAAAREIRRGHQNN